MNGISSFSPTSSYRPHAALRFGQARPSEREDDPVGYQPLNIQSLSRTDAPSPRTTRPRINMEKPEIQDAPPPEVAVRKRPPGKIEMRKDVPKRPPILLDDIDVEKVPAKRSRRWLLWAVAVALGTGGILIAADHDDDKSSDDKANPSASQPARNKPVAKEPPKPGVVLPPDYEKLALDYLMSSDIEADDVGLYDAKELEKLAAEKNGIADGVRQVIRKLIIPNVQDLSMLDNKSGKLSDIELQAIKKDLNEGETLTEIIRRAKEH